MLNLRQRSEADGFVTTEKDAINLGGFLSALEPLAVVPVKMELADAANAVDTMLARIAERRRSGVRKSSACSAGDCPRCGMTTRMSKHLKETERLTERSSNPFPKSRSPCSAIWWPTNLFLAKSRASRAKLRS